MKEKILFMIIGVVCFGSIACNQLGVAEQKPIAAVDLAKDLKNSKSEITSKYGGKEIVVRGYTQLTGTLSPLPGGGVDKTGQMILSEKDDQGHNQVWCEFGVADLADFQKIAGKQYITVKGIFQVKNIAGDTPYLLLCKLVKIE
jgi:Zn-dependent alcohol dehydrogenase